VLPRRQRSPEQAALVSNLLEAVNAASARFHTLVVSALIESTGSLSSSSGRLRRTCHPKAGGLIRFMVKPISEGRRWPAVPGRPQLVFTRLQ